MSLLIYLFLNIHVNIITHSIGFAGDDCGIVKSIQPFFGAIGRAYCDQLDFTCKEIHLIYGRSAYDSPDLSCKIMGKNVS